MKFILVILTLVLCRDSGISSLECDVKITDVPYSKDFVPAIANPYNILDLQLALQCCNVERARIFGWNDHTGDYLLYKNGAFVPAGMNNLPKAALFFKRCESDKMQAICFCNKDPKNPKYKLPCAYVNIRDVNRYHMISPRNMISVL